MASELTLAEFVALIQSEVQKSFEYSDTIAKERGAFGVLMSVTDCEIDLPVDFAVAEVSIPTAEIEETLLDASREQIAELRLSLPNAGRAIEMEVERLFDFGDSAKLKEALKNVRRVEADAAPASAPTSARAAATGTRQRRQSPAAEPPAVTGRSVRVAVPSTQDGDDATRTARLKLSFKAAYRDVSRG